MVRSISVCLVLCAAATTVGVQPPIPTKEVDKSKATKSPRLPNLVTPTPVAPSPGLDTVTVLAEGWEYIVDFDKPCIVHSFPQNLAVEKIELKAGETLLLPGYFVDGNGKRETRKFQGPLFLYRVTPVVDGLCELMVLEIGKDEGDMIVRRIDAKLGPRPPPHPPQPKPPIPKPPVPVPDPSPISTPGLHVLIVYDTGKLLPAEQYSIIAGKEVRDYLESHCVQGPRNRQYRIYDKTANAYNDSTLWGDAKKLTDGKTLPYCVISNSPKGGYVGSLPANPKEFLALLAKYE